jgi:hypothetical protein
METRLLPAHSGSPTPAPVGSAIVRPTPGPSLRTRLCAALAVAIICGIIAYWRTSRSPDEPGGDFWQHWTAARSVLHGKDPYAEITPTTLRVAGDSNTVYGNRWFYPLPVVALALPVAMFSAPVAAAVFTAGASGALAFLLTAGGLGVLAVFLSAPFVLCVVAGQLTAALVAASLVPAAQGLLVVKPTIGLALLAARPTRWAIIGGAILCIAAFVVLPSWPREWRDAVAGSPYYHAPILRGFVGPLLVLAALRWRRPEARILLVLACVPQLLLFYDQLPLALVPRSERERLVFAWSSWLAYVGWVVTSSHGAFQVVDLREAAPWVLVLVYLPALIMVLRRPNDGNVPAWLERAVTALPPWLRGQKALGRQDTVADSSEQGAHFSLRSSLEASAD